MRIGPLVTPLPRRRPVKLARETVSLDHLSNGRLILGVGIGAAPWEWDYLGEETDPVKRGAMLDEGLDLRTKLWTGEAVLHEGRFYRYRGDFGPGRPEVTPRPSSDTTERMTGAAGHACYGRRPVAACQQARTHSSSLSDRTRSATPPLITRV
jgi:alkanesulfonate monooxygenase SsuD/methylene tetrahydromethanopterin reductase-like flavin-dependent oxidoreductase (luciferase family)